MKRIFTITHDVYDSRTMVAIGVTDKAVVKWIERWIDVDDELAELIKCQGSGRTVQHGKFTMIRLEDWSGTNHDIAILTHEAFHLCEMIFDRIGLHYNMDISGEAFAYFIQHTVEQVLDKLRSEK